MPKADRDAYDLEETPERRYVLALAVEGSLVIIHANVAVIRRKPQEPFAEIVDTPLEPKHQEAYLELARAGLLIGGVITGKGHRAGLDWGVIK